MRLGRLGGLRKVGEAVGGPQLWVSVSTEIGSKLGRPQALNFPHRSWKLPQLPQSPLPLSPAFISQSSWKASSPQLSTSNF